jgi:arabinose-5-phosphate isomerase
MAASPKNRRRVAKKPAPGRTARRAVTPAPDHAVYGRTVVEAEVAALQALVPRLGAAFSAAVAELLACKGRVVVTGMGKPGFVAQKLSATLASSGTPSLYLHPAEALHGDLGRVVRHDLLLALSNSGRTEEVVRLLGPVKRIGARVIAMTGDPTSPLARGADVVLDVGKIEEACPLGLVPTASSMVLMALGDALAMTVLKNRASFGSEEYALFHPGGLLGRQVMRVEDVMRKGDMNPVIELGATLADAVVAMTRTPGRPGAANVVDRTGVLVGIFTDGDLRRLFERGEAREDRKVAEVMGRMPRTVSPDLLVMDAARVLREAHVDQVPVVDGAGRPVGLLDVQDLLSARVI